MTTRSDPSRMQNAPAVETAQALRAEPSPGATAASAHKELSPAAQRALAEAAERRAAIDARAAAIAKTPEHQGRGGLDPVRYEDWEVKGIATDF